MLDEHARTRAMLERLYGGPLAERRPDVNAAITARRSALRALHERQVTLQRYRASDPSDEDLLSSLLLTVNALAMGLGGTG